MAEMHVQRKERSVWPWILGAVVLLALLFWLFTAGADDDGELATLDVTDSGLVEMVASAPVVDTSTGYIAGAAVAGFLQFVDARSSRAADLSHDYTADGLRQLAEALAEIAVDDTVGDVALQPLINEVKERARAMQENPTSTDHALQAREAFVMASSVMMRMSTNRGNADGNLPALENAAKAIKPSTLLLEQADDVELFFAEAADAIRSMTDMPA